MIAIWRKTSRHDTNTQLQLVEVEIAQKLVVVQKNPNKKKE